MSIRKRTAALLTALLLCAAAHGEIIEAINHYVIEADIASYFTRQEVDLYRTLVDAVLARREVVTLSGDYDANLNALYALESNPLGRLVARDDFNADHTRVKITYAYPAREQADMVMFMDEEYLRILNEIIEPGMNELEKTLAVYGYFGRRLSYDHTWERDRDASDDPLFFPEIDICQALTTNRGVCHTYTYLCEYALQQLGVECLRFTGWQGSEENSHMWLAVRIDGRFYHCDPTWDDEGDEVGLRYFGMTDAERTASGVSHYDMSYDQSYGAVICDDPVFAPFRDAVRFELLPGHRLALYPASGDPPLYFDTAAKTLIP